MELSQELRELRDDLFGIGLDDSASREIKISFLNKDMKSIISFGFESPTYEEDVVKGIEEISKKILVENGALADDKTIEKLKVFGVHFSEDLDTNKFNQISRFSESLVNYGSNEPGKEHLKYTFKTLSQIAEWSLAGQGLESIEVSVLQKKEWETIYSYEFKKIYGSAGISGISGISGTVGLTGMSGISGIGITGSVDATSKIITYPVEQEDSSILSSYLFTQ